MVKLNRTLVDLSTSKLTELNELALTYILNTYKLNYGAFICAVHLTQRQRKRHKLLSCEGLWFWQPWIVAVDRWSHKFPLSVELDVMRAAGKDVNIVYSRKFIAGDFRKVYGK